MKTWKRALSAVMSICLVFSLFTGLNFTSAAAGTHGTLQNGALTENTDGWTIAGDLALAALMPKLDAVSKMVMEQRNI